MTDCLPQVQACAMRVAQLDTDGVPLPGAQNLYVSNAMSQVVLKAVYEAPTEISEKNACGALAINFLGKPSLKRYDVDITLLTPDPYLSAILGKGDVLAAGLHNGVGYAWPELGVVDDRGGVSIELWAKRVTDSGDLDPDFPYARWAMPRVRDLRAGDKTFGNAAQLAMFTGWANENDNWYDGPLNDWPALSDRVIQWLPVPASAVPAPTCGFQALAAS